MQAQSVDPAEAQEAARRILSERRFRPPEIPRPFEGVLESLGRAARRVWEVVFEAVDTVLPGPEAVAWTVLAAIVLATALIFAARLSRRQTARLFHLDERALERDGVDPRAIEARAREAERTGDFAAAVRLYFRAGLARLEAAGAIRRTEWTTSRGVARRLRSARFDGLAATFDQIVYGGRPATAADAEGSRTEWATLLADLGAERAA